MIIDILNLLCSSVFSLKKQIELIINIEEPRSRNIRRERNVTGSTENTKEQGLKINR